MKKNSYVGIGVGVAGLSGGQAVLLVMEGIVCFAPPEHPNRHQTTQKRSPNHSKIQVMRAIYATNR